MTPDQLAAMQANMQAPMVAELTKMDGGRLKFIAAGIFRVEEVQNGCAIHTQAGVILVKEPMDKVLEEIGWFEKRIEAAPPGLKV